MNIYTRNTASYFTLIASAAMIGGAAYITFSSEGYKAMMKVSPNGFWAMILPLLAFAGYIVYMHRKLFWPKPSLVLNNVGISNQMDPKNVEFVLFSDIEKVQVDPQMGYTNLVIHISVEQGDFRSSTVQGDRNEYKTSILQNPMTIVVSRLNCDLKKLVDEINRRIDR